jgi:hypothetical protein
VRRLVIVVLLLGVVLAVYGGLAARRHVDRALVTQPVRELDIDAGIGDVLVVGGRRTDVEVTHTYHYALDRPAIRQTVAKGVLRLSSRCSRFDFACTVRTRVEVPENTRLNVRVTAGGVDVRRLRAGIEVDARAGSVSIANSAGPVTVSTGTGLVTLERLQGSATVRTKTGDVVLDEVGGPAHVTAGEGDIKGRRLSGRTFDGYVESGIVSLSFTEAPVRVNLSTKVGGVTLRVPGGAYAVRARAAAGRVSLRGITRDAESERVIDVRAGAGNVMITGQITPPAR